MSLSIVVPLWNEAGNIPALIAMLADCKAIRDGLCREVVAVNNGSTDDSRAILDGLAAGHPWLKPLHLAVNRNYGGGIYEGCRHATGDFLCYIPGDLQYLAADVDAVTDRWQALAGETRILVKGNRTRRHDPGGFQFVSGSYTTAANIVLGLKVADVNGLPKLFHRDLLSLLPAVRMRNFVLDAQLIFTARSHGWAVHEVPVEFHARRSGVSSWSGKRMRVYIESFRQLFSVRAQRGAPGVPLPPPGAE